MHFHHLPQADYVALPKLELKTGRGKLKYVQFIRDTKQLSDLGFVLIVVVLHEFQCQILYRTL